MISLFLDTHSKDLNIGLVNNEKLLGEVKIKDLETHSNLFLCKVEEILKNNNLLPDDVDRIIVVNGPGSFTGIRIAVTVAKVYAFSLKKEIVTISSLEAYALSTKDADYVVPIIDARRGFVYSAIYDKNMNCILKDCYINLEELKCKVDSLTGKIQYVGYGNFKDVRVIEPDLDILKIVDYCKNKQSLNAHYVNPNYLKKTEAEENRDKTSK